MSIRRIVLVFVALAGTALMHAQSRDVNWSINGGENNIRFSPLTQVNKANVEVAAGRLDLSSSDHFHRLRNAEQSHRRSTACSTRRRRR
jgi:hypothetical protein